MNGRLHSDLNFAQPRVEVEKRGDGTLILRSPHTLLPYPRAVGEWLVHWARTDPQRVYLAERAGDAWRKVTYAEALEAIRRIGEGLLARGLWATRPLAILSDNSVDHALLALGAMHAGIPVAPISPAYSLMSRDHAKLKGIFELLQPGLVFAQEPSKFGAALAAVGAAATPLGELLDTPAGARIDTAFAAVGPDTVAKILFTSGSTGTPKGVINTQRMLCSNQQSWAQLWPFVEQTPPVLCEWLPWNHTFGGNATFNMVLRNGGTLYVDGGKPAPGLVETTVKNLREVSPTMYFNVPRGFDLLLLFLEADADLRKNFFRRLDVIFYAGAALPQNLWERLEVLAAAENGGKLAMLSAWGSTETSPMAACVHYKIERAGVVGVPGPGTELKLAPSGGKLEVRVRGPNVTPGYYRRDDLTAAAFDAEGFYRIGDAMKFADPDDPAKGIVFDGRVAEDFKLTSGTWVHVGAVRVKLIAACDPLVQDAVITGHDKDEVGALLFLNPAAAKALGLDAAAVRARLQTALARLQQESTGSSTVPARLLILDEPPSIDANEITDKGYINQSAVLERRAALAEKLHAGGAEVILVSPE
ncbi:MAG: feruloyl-CoA synthase [Betaproteobacteria bacterium]|nr:feruloyl-CoA synthase [Betaproteobacteria bacterium]